MVDTHNNKEKVDQKDTDTREHDAAQKADAAVKNTSPTTEPKEDK